MTDLDTKALPDPAQGLDPRQTPIQELDKVLAEKNRPWPREETHFGHAWHRQCVAAPRRRDVFPDARLAMREHLSRKLISDLYAPIEDAKHQALMRGMFESAARSHGASVQLVSADVSRRYATRMAVASSIAGAATALGASLVVFAVAQGAVVPNLYVSLTAALGGIVLLATIIVAVRDQR
jgi:hypothetical protein